MKRQDKNGRTDARHRKSGDGEARQQRAEALAVSALSFLAEDTDRMGAFLALSGIGPESIRDAAGEPHFLAGVLDHVVGDEKLLLDFADHENIDPFEVTRARATLGGRDTGEP
jgi:hypothetical protein